MSEEKTLARRFRFRLSETDRQKYPGDEWYTYDEEALLDEPASVLASYEQHLGGYTVGSMVAGLSRGSADAIRVMAWIVRRRAGVREQFESFDPRVWKMDFNRTPDTGTEDGDDQDPPAEAAPEESPAT